MSPDPSHVVVTTTVAGREDAERLADALLGHRLVACVQIVGIESRYRWQGEVVGDSELLLVAKTRADRWPGIEALVATVHPYEVPELVMIPLHHASSAYLAWIDEVTAVVED